MYALDGQFWTYQTTKWVPLSRHVLEGIILRTIKCLSPRTRQSTASLLRQAMALLLPQVAKSSDLLRFNEPPLPVINCKNGELWIQPDGSVDLKPHSPASYLRYCLDVEYD